MLGIHVTFYDFQLRLGYRCFTGRELSASNLHQRRPDKLSFSFEEFCCIVTECKRQVGVCVSKERVCLYVCVCVLVCGSMDGMFLHTLKLDCMWVLKIFFEVTMFVF